MKKIIYITLLLATVLFAGCKKYKVEFEGQLVEFKPVSLTLTRGTATTAATANIVVQLVGAQQTSDLVIPFTVDAANTTAVAGTNYTLSSTGTITIPANSSTGKITITSNFANNTTAKKLTLVLADGGPVTVSQNYKTCTVTLSTTTP
ncbi:MAG: hypothetical protein REI78_03645 [Pedobacter sp.]|nr:hypothetical protein [Pedobacter sp.]MDQ8052089.1 hypothetical protein [Pedobacter sp.]